MNEINKFFIHIDNCDEKGIRGWVINETNPLQPVDIDIFIDNEFIIQVTANSFRKDLLEVKIGNGNCAFNVSIPDRFLNNIEHNVTIYETTTKTVLNVVHKKFKFVNKFIGGIDICDEKGIFGWIANKHDFNQFINIDILIDNELIANVTADLFRQDLLEVKIGDGNHAFKLPMPAKFFDNLEHTLEIKELLTKELVASLSKKFLCKDIIQGKLEEITGDNVTGWISSSEVELKLYIDDQQIEESVAVKKAVSETKFSFQFKLPITALDGAPHLITVKSFPPGKIIGELAEIIPFVATPWEVLQKYAGNPLPAVLSPATAYRYDSMRATLKSLSIATVHKNQDEWKTLINRVAQMGMLHEILLNGFEQIRKFLPLTFPVVPAPTISIIIPVYNKFAVTYNCLCALLFAYNKADFEVIIVDDNSNDKTVEISSIVSGITYLRNEITLGFIRSCNYGGSIAKGKYVVMLNNDTEPTAYWLDEMIFVFEHFNAVGLVGSKLLYPDNKLQEAGGIVWRNGNPWNYGRGTNPHEPQFNYTRQVDYLSGASIMLPKAIWDQVGGFSEEFCPAYFEDTDLAFKVRAIGLKTVYAPLSIVYHFEGMSSGTNVASGIKRYQEINRPQFKRKWMHACRLNDEEGNTPHLNKDRGINYRALVIDYQTPRPDIDAGSYAAIQEMRLLQSLGFKITFIPENFAYLGQYTENLQRLGVEVILAPFVFSIQDFLTQRGKEFDIIYITRYNVAKNKLNVIRHHAPRAKILFCNADLHFLRQLREAIQNKDDNAINAACNVREEELDVMRKVDITLSYNVVEHAVILSHNLNSTKIVTCPWVVDVQTNIPKFIDRNDIAFLGGFGHPPNKGAVEFFIKQVMPILRMQLPSAKFRIYGSNIPEEINRLAGDDVIIEGYIEEVNMVYNTCRVFVAPLLSGAGIKGKVIDALAHGIPSVLSPIAVEGTLLRHELEVMIAETTEEWANAVTRLYTDENLWKQMSQAACNFAEQHYSFENGRKLMSKALEAVDVFVAMENQALVVNQTRVSVYK